MSGAMARSNQRGWKGTWISFILCYKSSTRLSTYKLIIKYTLCSDPYEQATSGSEL